MDIAQVPIVNDVLDAAERGGEMGLKAILCLFILLLVVVVWYQEKKSTEAQRLRDERYLTILARMEKKEDEAQAQAASERAAYHRQLLALTKQLRIEPLSPEPTPDA
jgi:hypothetical protein